MSRPKAPREVARAPVRRVVLLGASNLTNGFAAALDTAKSHWGNPLEVYAALGHGRSYGRASSVLFRRLPGILESGLWPALTAAPELPTAALLTDIGNDLLYEEPVEQIVAWIDDVLARLREREARIALTLLPAANLPGLSPRRYEFFRRLFVPRCRLTLPEVIERALELNEALLRLAAQHGATIVAQQGGWYGLDPMHITRRARRAAWREFMTPWSADASVDAAVPLGFVEGKSLKTLAPELRWLWGRERRSRQPVATLRDGTTLALY